MIEMFLTALPSLKIELQIDVASVLGWCALFRIICCHVFTIKGAILYPFATSFLLPVSGCTNLLEVDQ